MGVEIKRLSRMQGQQFFQSGEGQAEVFGRVQRTSIFLLGGPAPARIYLPQKNLIGGGLPFRHK